MDNKDQVGPIIHSKKQFRHSIDKKFIIIAVIIFMLVCGAAVWFFVQKSNDPENIYTNIKQSPLYESINKADDIALSGDINGAHAEYDKLINQTTDPKDKSTLLIGKASLFYNSQDYDQALKYAKDAEALSLNENVAQFIAMVYEIKLDKVKAIEYYKKAIELVDKNNDSADNYIVKYNYRIGILEGTSK